MHCFASFGHTPPWGKGECGQGQDRSLLVPLCHHAISMPHPPLAQTRVPQSPGQRASLPVQAQGRMLNQRQPEQRANGKTPGPRRLQGECDELPNCRQQKQVSKPGTTARNPRSSEMKSKSKWAAWNGGGAEAFPWGRHVRLALMCLQERGARVGHSRLKGAMGGMDRMVFPEGSSGPRAWAGEQHVLLEITRLISISASTRQLHHLQQGT